MAEGTHTQARFLQAISGNGTVHPEVVASVLETVKHVLTRAESLLDIDITYGDVTYGDVQALIYRVCPVEREKVCSVIITVYGDSFKMDDLTTVRG